MCCEPESCSLQKIITGSMAAAAKIADDSIHLALFKWQIFLPFAFKDARATS